MECTVPRAGYFIIAAIWNIAVASVLLFLVAWPLDILGALIKSEVVRGYAYGFEIIGTISTFWFGLLAALLRNFVRCKTCNSRALSPRYPFFVSLLHCRCGNCSKEMPNKAL